MTYTRLFPLLLSAGVFLGANGLMLTLVALRASQEGFSEDQIGLMGTAYFLGFLFAGLYAPRLIMRVGHIRVFAGLAAITAIAVLVMVLSLEPWTWILMRLVIGFTVTGISTVNESWLNDIASTANRGRVLSLYRVVDLTAVTGAQFLIPFVGAESFEIFAVAAILFCFGLLPVSLAKVQSPTPPEEVRIRLGSLWRLSPVAFVGVVTVGLTTGAFRTMAPLYAQDIGLTVEQVALFMSLSLAAGAVSQFPLGWLSDRMDRRFVLILATGGAAASSALLTLATGELVFVGAALFGAFALPLYSLSAAHAADHADPSRYVELSATLAIVYTIGGVAGPYTSSWVISQFGGPAFFAYTCSLHALFIGFVLYRMSRRAAVPEERRKGFVALLRNSPLTFRLSRANGDAEEAATGTERRDGTP